MAAAKAAPASGLRLSAGRGLRPGIGQQEAAMVREACGRTGPRQAPPEELTCEETEEEKYYFSSS
jgi:hypothetical protein